MRFLLVILLCVHSVAYAGGTGSAAWFAANWFKQQQEKVVKSDSDDDVVQPVGMEEYVKACTELTNDKYFCKKNWMDAKMAGSEVFLVAVDRPSQVRKTTKPEVTKVAKAEVKHVKYVTESKVKGVNLLDVSNEEYKARRAATLAKPNAIVIHETYR
jgi:hypothetical protein